MGFRLNRVYRLIFEDYPQLDGFEVAIRSTTTEVAVGLRGLNMIEDSKKVADLLAEHVIEWNYKGTDGEVLPIAPESFLSLEQPLLTVIVREWYWAAVGISAPLERTSTDTSPSPEQESIPMETP